MVSWTLVAASSQVGISAKEDITLKVCLLETSNIQCLFNGEKVCEA
jgi:hypothetical protein